jgi:hypothetical protein
MRLALAAASITATAALAVLGAAPALAAPSEPGTPTWTTSTTSITEPSASGTGPAEAVLPIALGGVGLAVLAGTGGYAVGRARRDPQEHHSEDEDKRGGSAARGQDTDHDGALAVPPPYCLWW